MADTNYKRWISIGALTAIVSLLGLRRDNEKYTPKVNTAPDNQGEVAFGYTQGVAEAKENEACQQAAQKKETAIDVAPTNSRSFIQVMYEQCPANNREALSALLVNIRATYTQFRDCGASALPEGHEGQLRYTNELKTQEGQLANFGFSYEQAKNVMNAYKTEILGVRQTAPSLLK